MRCGNYSKSAIFTTGDYDDGGPGVVMRDLDYPNRRQGHYYFFYENDCDDHAWKYTLLKPGVEVFISVRPSFAGRIVRGNPIDSLDGTALHNLGTWVEGYDGAAVLSSTDGSGVVTGFSENILMGATLTNKSDGSTVLGKTVGDEANFATAQYELGLLDPTTQAFIVQAYKPMIATTNGRWDLTLYPGTY
ncbi:hypothetical protein B0H63DRAFT_501112 [Podospora didyma]|uniref:Uncharacterized protein n=1 Tax=Podospora didyma TaxID=330526 RepID=A0AAE0NP08_9PEZI|nr:hypothetical protein B0H63DRAFT_501112 [Podospora didyma]